MTDEPEDGDYCGKCGADLSKQMEWLKTQVVDVPENGQCQECGHSFRRYERTIID